MKLSEKQSFSITKNQKQTLNILATKYNINVSNFIRDAVNEKLQREKESIFKNYKEVHSYLKQYEECPF
jgi:hypothetical protein